MNQPVLRIRNLKVHYVTDSAVVYALNDISFDIMEGQAVGLVGESGSGKSTVGLSVLGLLANNAEVVGGSILFRGKELSQLSTDSRRGLRGDQITIVFQDPFSSLNPSLPVGEQIGEPLIVHKGMNKLQALQRAKELLAEVGISRPAEFIQAYPHQLSGGMKQRALIATALACEPELLILDEPTTALDVTIEAQIMDLLEKLRRTHRLSIMFITHNLGLVARMCDEICVLYAGNVVELGKTEDVLYRPYHPYTKGLLASLPRISNRLERLSPIPGNFPDLSSLPKGCVFNPRCPFKEPHCENEFHDLRKVGGNRLVRCWKAETLAGNPWKTEKLGSPADIGPVFPNEKKDLVEINNVSKVFQIGGILSGLKLDFSGGMPIRYEPLRVKAVDDVSLRLAAGEILGLVGESGCGKSTLGRCLVRLITPNGGNITISGQDITYAKESGLRNIRKLIQIIFQNPDSSLNPRKTVEKIIGRPLSLFGLAKGKELSRRIDELLEMVRLSPAYAKRYPHQLSGGEKQRIGIARALATNPRFIVCDEPVSALDVSVQASILNLLSDLRDQLGVSYLFISHDLSVVSHIADRVAVMYRGAILEQGAIHEVLHPPHHPYTEALLSAVPAVYGKADQSSRIRLRGDVLSTTATIPGCPFNHRCPRKIGIICETEKAPAVTPSPGHYIVCHLPIEKLLTSKPLFQE